MPAPTVLRNLTPEVKKVGNPPAGQPVIATKAELRDGSRPGSGGGSGGFTPMVAEDFSGATLGATNSAWTLADYSNVVAKSGTLSTRLRTQPSEAAPSCGGDHSFGGYRSLPAPVPAGKTVWQRFYMYLPSAFSLGYAFNASNSCGAAGDGGLKSLKWLVFVPNNTTARIYFQPFTQYRQVLQAETPGARVLSEAKFSTDNASAPALPRDRWFALQMAIKVAVDTGDGYVRTWIDDELVASQDNVNTISTSDTAIVQWGIGNYWNGQPWTDGQPGRDTFYIDDVIVASDVDGYGAPAGVDSGGRPFIDPNTLVGDL